MKLKISLKFQVVTSFVDNLLNPLKKTQNLLSNFAREIWDSSEKGIVIFSNPSCLIKLEIDINVNHFENYCSFSTKVTIVHFYAAGKHIENIRIKHFVT